MDNNRTNEGLGGSSAEIPTVEGLKKLRMELEQKMLVSSIKKEGDIKKKLVDREVLIAEEAENEVLFDRAVETLAYFDGLKKQGLLTAEEDIQALIDLEKTIISLDEQRKGISAKHDSIMSIPEVEGAVMDEALAEDKKRNDKQNKIEERKKMRERAVEFVKKIDNLESDIVEYDKRGSEFSNIVAQMYKIYSPIADKNIDLYNYLNSQNANLDFFSTEKTAWAWWSTKSKSNQKMFSRYFNAVKEYKKKLGMFDFAKKGVLSQVLDNEKMFIDMDTKMEQFELIRNSLFSKFDELSLQYKDLIKAGYNWDGETYSSYADEKDTVEFKNPQTGEILEMIYRKNGGR